MFIFSFDHILRLVFKKIRFQYSDILTNYTLNYTRHALVSTIEELKFEMKGEIAHFRCACNEIV